MKCIVVLFLFFAFSSHFVEAKNEKSFKHGKDWITGLALSNNGKRFYSASFGGTFVAWDVQSGKQIWKIDADASVDTTHGDSATITHFSEMDLSPDEKILAVTADQSKITKQLINGEMQKRASKPMYSVMLLDASNGRLIGNLVGHEYKINTVAFSPDGRQIVSVGGDKEAKIWDVLTGKQTLSIPLTNAGRVAKFSPDGKTIAVSLVETSEAKDAETGLYDAKSGNLIRSFPRSHFSAGELDFSSDGQFLAIASNGLRQTALQIKETEEGQAEITLGSTNTGQGQIDVWELNKTSDKPSAVYFGQNADAVIFTRNEFLIYASAPNVRIINSKTQREVKKVNFCETILSMTASADGKYLAVSGKKGKIRIYYL